MILWLKCWFVLFEIRMFLSWIMNHNMWFGFILQLDFLHYSRISTWMFKCSWKHLSPWNLGLSKRSGNGILVVTSIILKSMSWRKDLMVLQVVRKGFMGSALVLVWKFVAPLERIVVQESVKPVSIIFKYWQNYGRPFYAPQIFFHHFTKGIVNWVIFQFMVWRPLKFSHLIWIWKDLWHGANFLMLLGKV